MNRFLLLLLVFGACIISVYSHPKKTAPQPAYKQFTVDNGLPSNETYHIVQDSIGYLWIATSNGISRFDGYSFKNFGLNDGLVESAIHEIYIDYKGRIWFVSSSGRLAYYLNGTIKPYEYNHRLNDYIAQSRGTLKKSFYVDSLDNVYISFRGLGRIVVTAEGIVKEPNLDQKSSILVEKINNGPLVVSNISILGNTSHDSLEFIKKNSYRFNLPNDTFSIANTRFRSPFHFRVLEYSNQIVMANGGRIKKIEKEKVTGYKDFGYEVIWMSTDKEKNLWVAPIEGGVHKLVKGNFYHNSNIFMLDDQQVTSVIQDQEGGYWFSSLSNGIFYFPNICILTYNEQSGLPSNRINAVFANRKGVYTGNEQGVLSRIDKNKITNFTIELDDLGKLPIRFLGTDSTDSRLWIGSSTHLHSLEPDDNIRHYYRHLTGGSTPRDMKPSKDGGYWIGSSWGIRKFNGKIFTYSSRQENDFSGIVNEVYEDAQSVVWMATNNGIWKYQNGSFDYLGDKHTLLSHSASCITEYKNKILIATKGVGLLVFDGINLWQITEKEGIASNYINKLHIAPSGIWLATNNGISRIRGNLGGEYSISNMNTAHGLPTNETNSVFARGNKAYVATTKGLAIIDINCITPNTFNTKCLITSFKVNGNDVDLTTSPILIDYNDNVIEIGYVGFAYKNLGRIQYRYKFNTSDAKWIYSTTPTVTFSGLSPGHYTFTVQAQNSDGLWGQQTELSFRIKPAYWQTYWFIAILTLMFTLVIFWVYRVRVTSLKNRNNLINNLNIYKQKSLRQQMNPHFIFNTLNSIQLYILEKDHISSHKYLTKFAKLMRLILDNSQMSSVPLKDELEALKLYLELESLRLSGKFEYFIDVENENLLDSRVPTLLIQPFVENSIWHGIMLKAKQEGWVKISITSEGDTLVCSIEDNGVGRKSAQEIRAKQDPERKSLGFKITAQRIELLNSLYKERFNIKYFDINNPDGSTGTKVVIKIPHNMVEENTIV